MTDRPPRLRFAPSPTGFFHVGSARTTLYNWLIAARTGGAFVLRIEDTDVARNREAWVDGIYEAMRWLGTPWTEGPYRQSERTALYSEAIARLWAGGHVYACDCRREDLVARVGERSASHGYDRHCRERGLEPGPGRALRFATPRDGVTVVHDVIRGDPAFEHATIEDFVVARGDGSPTFLLANVVDDLDLDITHVVRGEEHLPNTPKAILVWQALAPERPLPVFAHLPVLVNESRKKLSKRRDKVALEDFRLQGVLPEAMRNHLVLLGWSPGGDRELLTLEEMVELFRLEDVHPSPAYFDPAKLWALNGEYLRRLGDVEYASRYESWLAELVEVWAALGAALPDADSSASPLERARRAWSLGDDDPELAAAVAGVLGDGRSRPPRPVIDPSAFQRSRFDPLVPLVRERAKVWADVGPLIEPCFVEQPPVDEDAWASVVDSGGAPSPLVVALLEGYLRALSSPEPPADPGAHRAVVEALGADLGVKLGKAQAPIRVAVTGRTVGLPLFELLTVIGNDTVGSRIERALARLRSGLAPAP